MFFDASAMLPTPPLFPGPYASGAWSGWGRQDEAMPRADLDSCEGNHGQ